jgi:hypothetical protein
LRFALRAALALAAASGVCLAAAGCGSGSGGDPLASMTANQVVTKALGDLKSAPSFGISGTTVEGHGVPESMRLEFKHVTGCEGTVSWGSNSSQGSLYLVVIGGTAWEKPDDAYWKAYEGKSAAQVIALIGGRYLKGSASDSNFATLAQLCDTFASSFKMAKDLVKEAVTTVDGQRVVPLTDKKGTMDVTDTSSPRFLRATGTVTGISTLLIFTYSPVSLTAPPAGQTIDSTALGF